MRILPKLRQRYSGDTTSGLRITSSLRRVLSEAARYSDSPAFRNAATRWPIAASSQDQRGISAIRTFAKPSFLSPFLQAPELLPRYLDGGFHVGQALPLPEVFRLYLHGVGSFTNGTV